MRNVGRVDRILRAVLGVVLAILAFRTTGVWVWIAGFAAAVALLTAAVGYCPLYGLLGIRTCPAETPRATG
ncbi:MAG: DUF2892 domain-containing protein [Armatimonadota bacterium]|nr:DUF2892 domain-containing protein [Armatimonadota bacterium]MDR7445201.1 DUF2892 domain-containing protein [Armatimonadota bacterium]MDR7571090.1 DUF2892 domain-containing protein [Armatimonadota bacterium]MDR7613698.1 DUF2892 domain-containing protein [Armatimonadota bacterium]